MVRILTVRPTGRLSKEKKDSVDVQGHAPCKLLTPDCFIASSLVIDSIESKVSNHQDISRIKRCATQKHSWKKKFHDWAVGKYSANPEAAHDFNCFSLGRCWFFGRAPLISRTPNTSVMLGFRIALAWKRTILSRCRRKMTKKVMLLLNEFLSLPCLENNCLSSIRRIICCSLIPNMRGGYCDLRNLPEHHNSIFSGIFEFWSPLHSAGTMSRLTASEGPRAPIAK